MVPTEEKPVVGAQKVMIMESKSACRERHRIIMEDSKRDSKEQRIHKSQKTIRKMAIVSPYLSILTLNSSGLNSPILQISLLSGLNMAVSNICICLTNMIRCLWLKFIYLSYQAVCRTAEMWQWTKQMLFLYSWILQSIEGGSPSIMIISITY